MSFFSVLTSIGKDIAVGTAVGLATNTTAKLLGAGGSASSGGVNTQAYGSNRSSNISDSFVNAGGLMSPDVAERAEQDEIKVAQAYQGPTTWDLVNMVNSWDPKTEEEED